jgi:hypothetical protein
MESDKCVVCGEPVITREPKLEPAEPRLGGELKRRRDLGYSEVRELDEAFWLEYLFDSVWEDKSRRFRAELEGPVSTCRRDEVLAVDGVIDTIS